MGNEILILSLLSRQRFNTCLYFSGSAYMARDIFMHPTGKEKFRLDQYGQYGDGRSALHLVAELGNVTLWNLAVERPDCDLKVIFDKIDS